MCGRFVNALSKNKSMRQRDKKNCDFPSIVQRDILLVKPSMSRDFPE